MAYKPPKQTIVDNDLQNTPSSEAVFEALKLKIDEPTISGSTGQLLQLDGYVSGEAVVSWVNPPAGYALPSQTGNADKVLVTDGASESWQYAGLGAGSFPGGAVILGRSKPASLTGPNSTIIGDQAGNVLTSAANSVLIGRTAGLALTSGASNTVIGTFALRTATTGAINTVVGSSSAQYQTGVGNTFVGFSSGQGQASGSSASNNTGVGNQSLRLVTTGSSNVAIGAYSSYNLTTAVQTVSVGYEALNKSTAGTNSTAVGFRAAQYNTGASNTFIGTQSGRGVDGSSTGVNNTGLGLNSLTALTSGFGNVAIGNTAGDAITTGANNVIIGDIAGSAALSDTMIFAAGTAERFRVDSSGNMGIGTSTPAEKLEVVGAVKADEFTVTRGGGEVYRLDPHTHDEGTETTDFTINWSNGSVHTVTLNAAGPLVITMSNPVDGGAYALRVIQGATPGTVTWPANVKWPGGTPPVLSTNTGDIDVVNLLYYSDTATYYATFALAFA